MKARVLAGLCALGALTGLTAVSGCAAAPEAESQYAIIFESAQQAVVTEGVMLYAFDATQPETDCQSLTAAVRANGVLPSEPVRVFTSPMLTPCALLANGQETHLSLGFGPRTIVVEGFVHGAPVLIGCNAGTLQEGTEAIKVPLGAIDISYLVPATTCTQLSDHCNGKSP